MTVKSYYSILAHVERKYILVYRVQSKQGYNIGTNTRFESLSSIYLMSLRHDINGNIIACRRRRPFVFVRKLLCARLSGIIKDNFASPNHNVCRTIAHNVETRNTRCEEPSQVFKIKYIYIYVCVYYLTAYIQLNLL